MYSFGAVVLVPFPFTDLSATKVRPALIVSKDGRAGEDVVVCFITSKEMPSSRHALGIAATRGNGLKGDSFVRFDKIATLSKRIILGELGKIDPAWLRKGRTAFHGVFGFSFNGNGHIPTVIP